MKRRAALMLALGLGLVPQFALAAPPARNLCVELREASSADAATGWQVSSADARASRERTSQRLCVQNGETASIALDVTRPVQVWQMALGAVLPVAVPTTQWMQAGQRLTVRPRWAGGQAPVSVELATHASHFDPNVAAGSAEAPSRIGAEVQTTLRVPLGKWVTIASAGAAADSAADGAGVISSNQARPGRVLQLRVELAP